MLYNVTLMQQKVNISQIGGFFGGVEPSSDIWTCIVPCIELTRGLNWAHSSRRELNISITKSPYP